MLNHKGYLGHVEFDGEANVFHGEVINIKDVVTFQGETVDSLRQAFIDSVEDYLDFCRERGEEPEKPFSGKFVVRMNPELHQKLYIASKKTGKSINTFIVESLEQTAVKYV